MRKEKIIKEYDYVYIAEDNTRWETEMECKQYEDLLKDPTPLKALKFFDRNGNPIDIFTLGEIPAFCYLVVTENRADRYCWTVVKAILKNRDSDEASYSLPIYKGIYYNDWANAFNGGYGRNGWKELKSLEWFEEEIKYCQEQIELYKKFTKHLEK